MRRIIFLDIDGVLNCASTVERFHGCFGIEPDKVRLLRDIVQATGAEIVLSSTWRQDADSFAEVRRALALDGLTVEDSTPLWYEANLKLGWPAPKLSARYQRAPEILAWLKSEGDDVASYVILDDEGLVGPWDRRQAPGACAELEKRHVHTFWAHGLTPSHVLSAIRILLEGP